MHIISTFRASFSLPLFPQNALLIFCKFIDQKMSILVEDKNKVSMWPREGRKYFRESIFFGVNNIQNIYKALNYCIYQQLKMKYWLSWSDSSALYEIVLSRVRNKLENNFSIRSLMVWSIYHFHLLSIIISFLFLYFLMLMHNVNANF